MDTRRGFFGKLFGGLVAVSVAPKVEPRIETLGYWSKGELGEWTQTITRTMPAGQYTGPEFQAMQDYQLLLAAGVSPKRLRKSPLGKILKGRI